MSTLQMLDVAIGIIFIFLLLSLVCSAANEVLEAMLKNRASDLERGIKELLGADEINKTEKSFLEKFYNHPLIYSLFTGKYNSKSSYNLPSYIPSRNFALALLDIILPATSAKLSGAAGGSSNAAAVQQIVPAATDLRKDETPKANVPGAPPPKEIDEIIRQRTESTGVNMSQNTAQNIPLNPLGGLREAVIDMTESNAKQALLTLIDAAGNDMNKVRENIEIWYNSSMDRVAGWYKRRVQWILIVLGLLTAIAMNADTIAIFKSLMKDEPLRNSLVAATAEYAKANNSKDFEERPQDRVESNIRRLNDLRLPIGWDWNRQNNSKDSAQTNNTEHFHNYVNNAELAIPPARFWPWFFKVLGWLLTALAVSQGAPFWFDLLNKFMVIRSTVKPHEKSPEEGSEDRQKK